MPGFIGNRGAPDAKKGEFLSNWSRQLKRILRGHNSLPSIKGGFLTRGRPRRLKGDCKPNCLKVDAPPSILPEGDPRWAGLRTTYNSLSVNV